MFSGGVRLGDLDDFIAPAQDCVAPLLFSDGKVTVSGKTKDRPEKAAAPVRPDLIKKKTTDDATTKAEVSLSDCLACSGCVTSAETVLLQEQSVEEFKRRAQSRLQTTVVSISPESLVSISDHFALDALTTMRKLSHVLTRDYGVHFVCDMHAAYCLHKWERRKQPFESSVLSSTCPGWTLYAEKVCDPAILPKISTVRSPQHIQGSLVKRHFVPLTRSTTSVHGWTRHSRMWSGALDRIQPWWNPVSSSSEPAGSSGSTYHVMVAPCWDRKIEAVRPSYILENGEREVDTVLATTELLSLLPADFASAVPSNGAIFNAWNLRQLAHLPAILPFWDDDSGLGWKQIRGDLFERAHEDGTKSVRAYGFKNVQNAIRRVRTTMTGQPSREKIRTIEVMACPSSCLNGGGQIRGADTESAATRIERLQALLPYGEIPDAEALRRFYEVQPQEHWTTEFHSLKGASLRW